MAEKVTQTGAIMDYLMRGNQLTSKESFERFGCTRLSGRIFDLRAKGIPVESNTKTVKTRYGTSTTVACYYIPEEYRKAQNHG